MPMSVKLKSLTRPEFESIGLMTPPNLRVCLPLVQARSSRIVGTRTNRSWELMLAKGAAIPKSVPPKVPPVVAAVVPKTFGDAGVKLAGNSNPERDTPTVAWFTTDDPSVQLCPTTHE